MKQTPPSSNSGPSCLVVTLGCGLICAALIGLSYFLDNTQKASEKPIPIPVGTPADPQSHAVVTCNDLPMAPNEICEHYMQGMQGTGQHYTYDQQMQYQREQRIQNAVYERDQQYSDQVSAQKQRYKNGILSNLAVIVFFIGVIVGIVTLIALFFLLAQWWEAIRKKMRQPSRPL